MEDIEEDSSEPICRAWFEDLAIYLALLDNGGYFQTSSE